MPIITIAFYDYLEFLNGKIYNIGSNPILRLCSNASRCKPGCKSFFNVAFSFPYINGTAYM